MKNILKNSPLVMSLFFAGGVFNALIEDIGTKSNPSEFTVFDAIYVGGVILSIWLLGYFTRHYKN